MPSATQIGNVIEPYLVRRPQGQLVLYDNSLPDNERPPNDDFDLVSGSTVGTSIHPDLAYNATFPVTIKSAVSCPYPLRTRLKIRKLLLSMLGVTAWTTLTALQLQDGNGFTLVNIPTSALATPNGLMNYVLPASDNPVGISATATGTYNATTGATTFPASSFVSTGLVNSPFMIVAGTGAGQTGTVKTCTATVMTPNVPFLVAPDSTSVFTFFYANVTGGSGTTVTIQSNATLGDLSNNYHVVVVAGTGVGQVRKVASSSFSVVTQTITVAAWTTNLDTTSVIAITQAPQLNGIIDLSARNLWGAASIGKGLQWAIIGSAPGAGSSLRYEIDGFWSYFY